MTFDRDLSEWEVSHRQSTSFCSQSSLLLMAVKHDTSTLAPVFRLRDYICLLHTASGKIALL